MITRSKKVYEYNPIYNSIKQCIINIFNLQPNVFEKVISDYTQLFLASNAPKEEIDISTKIGSGTYGEIYKLPNKKAIIKVYKNTNLDSIIQENMVHIILHCLQSSLKLCFGHPIPDCIPRIYQFIKKPQTLTIMEKLDETVQDYLKKVNDFDDEKNLFIAIMYQLYFLQKTTYFVHRDLHSQNIMIKLLKNKQNTDIYINNVNIASLSLEYQIYFIDFGFTCLSFGKCGIDLPDIVAGTFYDSKKCINRSHDARLFFASLFYEKHMSTRMQDFFKPLFSQYQKKKNFKKFDSKNHYFYNEVIDYVDNKFLPENIISNLLKI